MLLYYISWKEEQYPLRVEAGNRRLDIFNRRSDFKRELTKTKKKRQVVV